MLTPNWLDSLLHESIFVSNIGFSFNAIKITRCGIKNFSKVIALPLINGIVMVLSIFTLKDYTNTTGILGFISLVGIGILISISTTYLFDRYLNYRMRLLIKESLISLKGN